MLRIETLDGDDVARSWDRIGGPLVDAYVTIFNRDWNESWTRDSAADRIRASLRHTESRHPVVTLGWDGPRVAAFALGSIVTGGDGIDERDLPAYYPLRAGQIVEARDALVPAPGERFVLGCGWAVRPEFRDLMTVGTSVIGFFERCRALGCSAVRGWTSRRTRGFFLYLAAGARVLYDFDDEARLCLFSAPIRWILLLSKLRFLRGVGVALLKAHIFLSMTVRGLLAEQTAVRGGAATVPGARG